MLIYGGSVLTLGTVAYGVSRLVNGGSATPTPEPKPSDTVAPTATVPTLTPPPLPTPTATSNLSVRRINADRLTIVLGSGIEIEMVRIPAGEFIMGSDNTKDPSAYDDEQPQHRVNLGEYWLGKTEVTVEQFALFVKTTGYVADPRALRSGKERHPVNNVSWDDAVAFCKWVSDGSKLKVRLPSEAEWEKGARGTGGRIYAWGNQAIDRSRANYVDAKVGDTTVVGTYSPAGDSPYGLQDMLGNVWEWTRSLSKPYPYNANDGRESDSSRDNRVVRGGAFNYDERDVRCAFRNWYQPDSRYYRLGFRCLLSPPL